MVYAEQDVGFWLSYTIPTVVLCFSPLVMWWGRRRYKRTPPQGSVLPNAFRLLRIASSNAWSWNFRQTLRNIKSDDFWEVAKPSYIEAKNGEKPQWMTFDDRELPYLGSFLVQEESVNIVLTTLFSIFSTCQK